MILGSPGIRARRVTFNTYISASGGLTPPTGAAHVARQLGHGGTTGGELEEVSGLRGVAQESVLVAGIVIGTGAT
jgi:hypothetical protein